MKDKKCKSCGETFTPKAMGQHCCSLPCSIAYDKTKKKARKPKKAAKRKGGGVKSVVETADGKAVQKITYPQTDAVKIQVRISAESNGIKDYIQVRLPTVE